MSAGRTPAVVLLIGAIVLWSGSLSIVSIAVDGSSSGTVTFWRCAIGAIVLITWAVVARLRSTGSGRVRPRVRGRDWFWTAISGAGCGAAFLLVAHGMQRVGSGPAGIVLSSIPGLTMLIAAIERGAPRIRSRQLASLAVGACAALMLASPAGGGWSSIGLLTLCCAALSQAVTNVASGRALIRLDPLAVSAASMAVASLVTAPLADFSSIPTGTSLFAIIALGVLPSGVAYVWYFAGVRALGATTAAFSNFLVPPVAVFLGVVVLGEVPDARTLVALVFAIGALWLGLGRRRTRVTLVTSSTTPVISS